MNSKYLLVAVVATVAFTLSVHADDYTNNTSLSYEQKPPPTERYQANEFSLDAFGTAAIGQYTVEHLGSESLHTVRQDTKFGAGAGVNYFATRYVGIGGEGYWQNNNNGPFVASASGNLMLRLPLGDSGFAPYILGGGGHQFNESRYWFGQAGGGLEFRFLAHLGIFADARVVWPNETKAYGVCRAGLRFSF